LGEFRIAAEVSVYFRLFSANKLREKSDRSRKYEEKEGKKRLFCCDLTTSLKMPTIEMKKLSRFDSQSFPQFFKVSLLLKSHCSCSSLVIN
jgi:hypothetical protein